MLIHRASTDSQGFKNRRRPGDWLCPDEGCQAHNYSDRKDCYLCHKVKGTEFVPVTPAPDQKQKSAKASSRKQAKGPVELGPAKPRDFP